MNQSYLEFLRRIAEEQRAPVEIPVEQMAQPMEEQPAVDPLQASLEQKQAGTLDAQKRYTDWLQGLAKRSNQAGAMQSEALAKIGKEALGSRAVNQMGAVAMSLLNQPGLAKMYGEQAQSAAGRFGDSQKAGATQFGDYLAKTAGIEERALGGQLDAATKAEGMALDAVQKKEAELLARIRRAEDMAARATTAAEKLAWEKEKHAQDMELKKLLHKSVGDKLDQFAEHEKVKWATTHRKDLQDVSLNIPGWVPKMSIDPYGQPFLVGASKDGAKVIKDAYSGTKTIKDNVTKLIDILENKRVSGVLPGEVNQVKEALATIIALDVKGKAMADLGVLAGPDMDILRAMIPGLQNGKINIDLLSQHGGAARLRTLISSISSKMENSLQTQGYEYNPDAYKSLYGKSAYEQQPQSGGNQPMTAAEAKSKNPNLTDRQIQLLIQNGKLRP
jgi:hypothetical protein